MVDLVKWIEQWTDRVAKGCVQRDFDFPEVLGSDMKGVGDVRCTSVQLQHEWSTFTTNNKASIPVDPKALQLVYSDSALCFVSCASSRPLKIFFTLGNNSRAQRDLISRLVGPIFGHRSRPLHLGDSEGKLRPTRQTEKDVRQQRAAPAGTTCGTGS